MLAVPVAAEGQAPPDSAGAPVAQTVPADTVPADEGVSPGGAFLRAVLVPGWGHASIGSHGRGGFYLGAQAGTLWMIVRTRGRVDDARRALVLRETLLRAELEAQGLEPEQIEAELADDPRVARSRGLVAARDQQVEDWTALGIFLVLLSGADAFVSAHLQGFPGPVEIDARSTGGGGLELEARVPLGGR